MSAARSAGLRAVAGDRPLVAAFMVALALSAILLSGPMRSYLGAHERVEVLASQRDALATANAELEQQARDLNDPEQLELRAREDGFVRPGEVPYVVVPPEVERPLITEPPVAGDTSPDSWWVRAWKTVTGVFGD